MAYVSDKVQWYNATTRRDKFYEYQRTYKKTKYDEEKMKRAAFLATGASSDGQLGSAVAGILAAEPFTEMAVAGALV